MAILPPKRLVAAVEDKSEFCSAMTHVHNRPRVDNRSKVILKRAVRSRQNSVSVSIFTYLMQA